ncbi:MAG: phage portal protein, partial [Acidobacteria bacterium]|nr:phage portal protein [Acidobacteriota bacterium]
MLDWLLRPWRRPEARSSGTYDDLVVRGLEQRAAGTGGLAAWRRSAAAEICAGAWARGLATAEVTPRNVATACLTPSTLAAIARRLATSGEFVAEIDVDVARGVQLIEAWSHDVYGPADPAAWEYRLTTAGPTRTTSRRLPAAAVCHVRYAWLAASPWRGMSPAEAASAGAGVAGGLDRQLGNEAGAHSGYVVPVADAGGDESEDGDDPMVNLKAELKDLRGGVTLAPTQLGGLGQGPGAAPAADYRQQRFGIDPPEEAINLRRQATEDLATAYGVPAALVDPRASGTTYREGRRVFLVETLPAIGALIAEQIGVALDVPDLAFNFGAVSDIATRARAANSLVQA